MLSEAQRSMWILWLYDQLSECQTEEEAEAMVALIDHEESYLKVPPPKGNVLDDILLKPWRRNGT